MSSKKKLLYSKRYPPVFEEVLRILDNLPPPTEEDTAACQNFFHNLDTESIYVLKPERIEASRQFVMLAKELSETHEFDIDIIQASHYIDVYLHLYYSIYDGRLKRDLAQLINMCDQISFEAFDEEPTDFTISLVFNTHDFYLGGRLINKS